MNPPVKCIWWQVNSIYTVYIILCRHFKNPNTAPNWIMYMQWFLWHSWLFCKHVTFAMGKHHWLILFTSVYFCLLQTDYELISGIPLRCLTFLLEWHHMCSLQLQLLVCQWVSKLWVVWMPWLLSGMNLHLIIWSTHASYDYLGLLCAPCMLWHSLHTSLVVFL